MGSDPILADLSGGRLLTATDEQPGLEGEVIVTLAERHGLIHADLSVGTDLQLSKLLLANDKLANRGVIPHGAGFVLTESEAVALGLGTVSGLDQHLRPYRNGKDLTDRPRFARVIDLYGLSADEVRQRLPHVYQWLLERVKPEREQNNRARVRDLWWLFAEASVVMRASLRGLSRYIATGQVAKHRVFHFLETSILPDSKLIAIALDDAFHLGVLSSTVHVNWALATGGTLENRPVYSTSTCFDTDPFPAEDIGLTPALRQKISQLAEQIDHQRKRVLGLLAVSANSPPTLATPARGLPGADLWAFDRLRPPANPEPARYEPTNPENQASNQALAPRHFPRQAGKARFTCGEQPLTTRGSKRNASQPKTVAMNDNMLVSLMRIAPNQQAQEASNVIAFGNAPDAPPSLTSAATEPDPLLATPVTAPELFTGTPKLAKDLTQTGRYNVLQALREGRPLNPKEKHIHSAGLVGVLKTLHDELDAAVLAAYGWGDLSQLALPGYAALTRATHSATTQTSCATPADIKDELLQRLVALNQRRALEEANGQVRWLRPAFQNTLSRTELPAQVKKALEVDLASNPVTPVVTTQSWPSALPEQVKAVAQVLSSNSAPLTLAQIAACFGGSAGLKKSLPTLLQTLEALGRAQQLQSEGTTFWRA